MVNKNLILILASAFLLISILSSLPSVNAVGEISFCCEKTTSGAWCQNEPEANCATGVNPETNQPYRKAPTSCEATGFCKTGTCVNVQEGECMENTPEIVCNQEGGFWDSREPDEIQACSLGCCLIGEQAAFVTQNSCKRLSGLYGLDINFRTDITNEIECIATATSDVKGACVITEQEFTKNCKITTQQECNDLGEEAEFHSGFLCSAPQLETICGPSTRTTCVEGKDEVYYVDTCGNIANIYDASKQKDNEYWTAIKSREESCSSNSANAGSSSCGSCDYFLGSTCKAYDRSLDKAKPTYGDNVCRDLSCKWEGENYQHGETWCASNSERTGDLPGTEYFRLVCYNSEVTIESCASFRGEKCVEGDVNGFSTAACRANRWQDCIAQDDEKDCSNTDKRDCSWINSGNKNDKDENIFVCVPRNAPGFDFWNAEGEAAEICSIANTECTAVFQKGLLPGSDWECKENCECCVNGEDADGNKYKGCTGSEFESYKTNICTALGDCGATSNYVGANSYHFDDDPITCNGDDCYWKR